MKACGVPTAGDGRAVEGRQARLLDALVRFLETLEASLGDGPGPGPSLRRAAARHGFALPRLPQSDRMPPPHPVAGIRVSRDVLFGTPPPGPPADRLPAQAARLVAYGAKPACVIQGAEADMARAADAAFRSGLVALMAPTETVLLAEAAKGGFSNLPRDVRPARPGSGGWRELVVAREEPHAVLAWVGLTYGWDALLGRALGFPACCIDRFVTTWDRVATANHGDPAEQLLERDCPAPADWRVNVLGRYFGFRVLEHFPCRWDCPAAARLAHGYARALAAHEPGQFDAVRAALRCPYVFAADHGVFAFPGGAVSRTLAGWRVTYPPAAVRCTRPGGELADRVGRADALVASATSVTVLGRRYAARPAFFV